MSRQRKNRYFVNDLETTVYENQDFTEAWASASVELFTEDVHIFHSLEEQWNYFLSLKSNLVIYCHNLKFDGAFWISFFLLTCDYKQAYDDVEEYTDIKFRKPTDMDNNTFGYLISEMGLWYSIRVKVHDKIIEFRDSYKLLPFSLATIGKSFKTKHQKTEIEYTGFRWAGCEIKPEEQEYIANDVLVIKEALEIMFTGGHKRITIGSCCLAEYKSMLGFKRFEKYFPDLKAIELDEKIHGCKTAWDWIRRSYRGGWCYVARGKESKLYKNGCTLDVNSLYPSVMSSKSGCIYPTGEPTFWTGAIPAEALKADKYYFVRIRCQFNIKEGYLPFIQIKNNLIYRINEMLETSDYLNPLDGKYYSEYINLEGEIQKAYVELTLTMTDFTLIKKHYVLYNVEVIDGCYFSGRIGIFDEYIEKYKKIKMTSKGAKRQLAKLFLNNLYGKMASSDNSSFKVAYLREDKSVGYFVVEENEKDTGYIAVGSAITSYARCFTITAAQMNYYGRNSRGFIYADTDSIHCDLLPDEIRGVRIDNTNFCCWKLESQWSEGFFVRQKTYIENITIEDGIPLEKPKLSIVCAGMPERCKELLRSTITGEEIEAKTPAEERFLKKKRKITDLKIGLSVPSKLIPRTIRGGVVLKDTTFELR